MKIRALDHLVLTVRSIEETCRFYGEGLGMEVEQFDGGRWALKFGNQKFNLHQAGNEFEPKAENPAPGTQDFCLLVESLQDCQTELEARGIAILEGPV
ncbi:MAG: VOC family protein, partial [Methyloligellaceae bacterium]